MEPMAGFRDHVTAVLLVPVTAAVNCCGCDGPREAPFGVTLTATVPVPDWRISMALILALFTILVSWMLMLPVVTGTENDLSSAVKGPPACAMMSKFGSTVLPFMATLNTRCPGALMKISANFRFTVYVPLGTLNWY